MERAAATTVEERSYTEEVPDDVEDAG